MRTIHFLGNYHNCYCRHFNPIRIYKKYLLSEGIITRFFHSPTDSRIYNCDVLVVFADGFREILPEKFRSGELRFQYLGAYFNKFAKVIWFDDDDSTGMLSSRIFPLVDIYAKAQCLVNTEYYLEEHHIGSLHRDYVHEQFGVNDRSHSNLVISREDLKKLRLAWNLSLINWNYYHARSSAEKLRYFLSPGAFRVQPGDSNLANRNKQVIFRGRMWQTDPSVGWWRENTLDHVNAINAKFSENSPDLSKMLTRQKYTEELLNSIVCPSPFGKGEICYRDFESFMTDSLLFKPSMEQVKTWPDLYVDGVTYISHKWDFSDFNDKVEEILTHPGKYEDVAKEGERRFAEALSDGKGFVSHFVSMIGEG